MNYYDEIKNKFIDNETYKQIKDYSKNKHELETYYEVGKLLVEAQGGEKRAKYGDGLIKEYSQRLTRELGKGYSERSLKYMRKFYLFRKGQPLVAQLTWSHYVILLSINNTNKINCYIDKNVKTIYHNKTMGIIIAKRDNRFVIEYCSNKSIFNTTYELVYDD